MKCEGQRTTSGGGFSLPIMWAPGSLLGCRVPLPPEPKVLCSEGGKDAVQTYFKSVAPAVQRSLTSQTLVNHGERVRASIGRG